MTWITSKPKTHSQNVEAEAARCGYNFRRIIKMIKHWNRIHSHYLQSYHIEVLTLKLFDTNIDDTPGNVHLFFDKARELLKSNLWHEGAFVDKYLTYSA